MKQNRINPMSAKRRAELAASGISYPLTTFTSPVKPVMRTGKRAADTGPGPATVELVLGRDNWSCVVCGDGLWGRRGHEWSIHHRILRSHGVDNRPSNLISVCGHGSSQCHGDLHSGPAGARHGGWMLRSTEVPKLVVMAHSQHGWVLLDNEGDWARAEPPYDPMEAQMGAGEGF